MKIKFINVLSLGLLSLLTITSCTSKNSNTDEDGNLTYLHVLNAEDYIDESLITEFEEKNPGVKVIYETFDTNETMYNQLQTGKASYDLINCSEYMVQRLASEGLIQKVKGLDTYYKNVSKYLVNSDTANPGKIDKISVYDKKSKDYLGKLSEYAIGYMWGTLGIVYNPYYSKFAERGLTKDYLETTLNGNDGWSAFWDKNFKGVQSIKDSMRDTYALGILEIYKDKFLDSSLTQEEKNKIFNLHDADTIEKVKDELIKLKSNIFGFEVDSGKNDIVTQKIGMNLAWSGDACFSILKGEFYPGEDESYEVEKPESAKTKLYYAIPKTGANIWFDAWCMPTTVKENSKNYEYSIKFLDFLSESDSVTRNMSYTGYTSFMSGENNEVYDYLDENYSQDVSSTTIEYDISYFFGGNKGEFVINVDPDTFEGRTMRAQYPTYDEIDNLYVMEDFGNDNNKIVQMWEDVKVNPLPTFVIVLLVGFFVVTLGYLGTYQLIKKYKVKKRKELRNN